MGKAHSIHTGYALLAQAVVSKALIDGCDAIIKSPIYQDLFAPLIYTHNELYPDEAVADPYALYMNQDNMISVQYVREHTDTYFMILYGILMEKGSKYGLCDTYKIAIKNKWLTKAGYVNNPTAIMSYFTGCGWSKSVVDMSETPTQIAPGGYVIRKKYDSQGNAFTYVRVYGDYLPDIGGKGIYIILRQLED